MLVDVKVVAVANLKSDLLCVSCERGHVTRDYHNVGDRLSQFRKMP